MINGLCDFLTFIILIKTKQFSWHYHYKSPDGADMSHDRYSIL